MAEAARRRIHLLCVGAPKSGTHSVADLFAASFRSEHEPDVDRLIAVATGYLQGAGEDEVVDRLRSRDRELDLEVEASNPLGVLTPLLVRAFPRARFVITIREPLDWLRSEVNSHLMTVPETTYWAATSRGTSEPWPGPARPDTWRRLRFGHDGPRSPGISRHLVELGLFPIEGYLTYWTRHYRACLAAVAAGRAFIIPTHRLTAEAASLAHFAGVDPRLLDYTASHSFAALARSPLVTELDSAEVGDAAERICGPMWRAYEQMAGASA